MSSRVKVPRASLACTMLDDPDLIALLQDSSGIQAHSLFCLLLMAAKTQNNGGTFKHSTAVIAAMVRLPVEAFKVGLATLLSRTDWIIADANSVTIRSYRKWNAWGGSRDGAGRKSKPESSRNQDATKPQSKPATPASVSVSSTTTTLSDKSDGDGGNGKQQNYSDRFGRFWDFFPRKIGKGKAWAVFKRLKVEDQDAAIEQAEAYAQAYEMAPDQRRQYFKHPATWINARSWEDDHAEWELLIEGK